MSAFAFGQRLNYTPRCYHKRQAASFREYRCETERLCCSDVGGCGENQSISLVIAISRYLAYAQLLRHNTMDAVILLILLIVVLVVLIFIIIIIVVGIRHFFAKFLESFL
jgi:hypothetical protein